MPHTPIANQYPPRLSTNELRNELSEMLDEQRTAGHAPSSLQTQLSHTVQFLNWLDGTYTPRSGKD